ncbi:YjgN family protein [Rhizobium daejeonense]
MTAAQFIPAFAVTRGEFRGRAGEYFGIWIVNILLTIVTAGIYSAWAKVRRNRYFYGNTFVDGHSFDYHARGKQIFIGRLIVFAYLIVYNIVLMFQPFIGLALALGMLLLLPWIVSRSLRFNARVTSYRNIRFDFLGKTWGAFVAIILGGLVSIISLGILAPFASRWLYRYVFNNLRYGDRAFATDPRIGKLYGVWWVSALISLVGFVIAAGLGFLFYAASASNMDFLTEEERTIRIVGAIYGTAVPLLVLYAVAAIFYRVGVRNVVMQATLLDGRHRLYSDLSRFRYFWIVVSNLVVSVMSFGLMRPWAAIRERRYTIEHSGIAFDGDIGEVIASIEDTGSAVTAEYIDMEGFDFGF